MDMSFFFSKSSFEDRCLLYRGGGGSNGSLKVLLTPYFSMILNEISAA